MLYVVVDRQKWIRGGESSLRTRDGDMCISGFVGWEWGLSLHDMSGQGTLAMAVQRSGEDVEEYDHPDVLVEGLVGVDCDGFYDTDLGEALMDLNDSPTIPEDERERKMTALLGGLDIDVNFYGTACHCG